ncbi:MAG: ligase-associated DNA damage response endonuclease PdeM [Devosiaceae bacterium]|nr:ligase-associated DNA damage response endonuclease PdeM [Devosiaceae bacterium MH13]
MPQTPDEPPTHADVEVAGGSFVADRSGALYWPEERLLIVSDLHLEKGSSFARHRNHIPPYDTAVTLKQLRLLIDAYAPARVVSLGDSVHDRKAWSRLGPDDQAALTQMVGAVTDWVWITGNHDPEPPQGIPGLSVSDLYVGSAIFRHHPGGPVHDGATEIAGHLHPAPRVVGRGASARRPAFVTDGMRMILPAFGAYTGGLCLSSPAFKPLFQRQNLRAFVCGRSRVFTVPGHRIMGWG